VQGLKLDGMILRQQCLQVFLNFNNGCFRGCNHYPTNQNGHQIVKKNSKNWINIYVLPSKTMTIMANYCIFIHMNVKEFKPKIHLIKFKFKF
jgi:hypothetical protein